MTRRLPLSLVVVAALIAACSPSGPAEPTPPSGNTPTPIPITSGGPSVVPVFASSEVAVGQNRFLFGLIDPSTTTSIAAPDRAVSVRFISPDGGNPIDKGKATFIWGIEGERGVYVSLMDFPSGGEWTAEFTTPGLRGAIETIRATFPVADDRSAIGVGEPAPSVDTPIAADVDGDLARISTDTDPLPALYQTSVAQALEDGKAFLLAFATPKFCRTAQCGPTLDRVKPFVERYPTVAFINVEPYKLVFEQDQLQPELDVDGQLQVVPAVDAYGIRAEPWVYVVDRTGIISGSFELIFSDAELEAALDAVK